MPRALIEYKERTRGPVWLWAWKEGTKVEIRRSALALLDSLREEGHRRATVFVDGRRVRNGKEGQ